MCSYESIKSSIRLLLTSSSNGLSLDQLNCDYQYYNQSENIPYTNFGYSTLLDFLRDMSDVVQFDNNSYPPMIYGIKSDKKSSETIKCSISNNKNSSVNKRSLGSKNIKRLALNSISNPNHSNFPSTEHIIHQLTNLTMNKMCSSRNLSENIRSNELLTVSINSTTKCQIVRNSNGKYYIPCFELARILDVNENILDKETMFSRLRIYQSNDLFYLFQNVNYSCQHIKSSPRSYFFLFLISSIIPLLKMNKNLNQYYEIIIAFEQLFTM